MRHCLGHFTAVSQSQASAATSTLESLAERELFPGLPERYDNDCVNYCRWRLLFHVVVVRKRLWGSEWHIAPRKVEVVAIST